MTMRNASLGVDSNQFECMGDIAFLPTRLHVREPVDITMCIGYRTDGPVRRVRGDRQETRRDR